MAIGLRLLSALLVSTGYAAAQGPSLSTLYNFVGGNDGANPHTHLLIGTGGVLYGTTQGGGGPGNCGTVFSLTPPAPGGSWSEAVLYGFQCATDGAYPDPNLAIGGDGVLYGTSIGGGLDNDGIVFSLTPPASPGGTWVETVLHTFGLQGEGSGGDEGGLPKGGVVIGTDGVLYGTTEYGGIDNRGTVFSLTPVSLPGHPWAFATLYDFQNLFSDGNYPVSGVVIGDGGVLYGTTFAGGTTTLGVVFSLTPSTPPGGRWTEAVLYSFMDVHPTRLTLGAGGLLYGPAVHQRNKGSFLFSLTPTSSGWVEAPLYESQFRLGALAFDKSGVLAGTTGSQGETAGTVFALTL